MASAQGAQSDSQLESDRIRKHWLQNSREWHILVRFLRFKAREEVLGGEARQMAIFPPGSFTGHYLETQGV